VLRSVSSTPARPALPVVPQPRPRSRAPAPRPACSAWPTSTRAARPPPSGNFLTAYGTGSTAPLAAKVNFSPGDTYNTVENSAYAITGTGGGVSILNSPSGAATANVVVDEPAYFTPSSGAAGAYIVTGPLPSATPTVSTCSTPDELCTSNGSGAVTYSASGLPDGATVDIALFPTSGPKAPVTSGGVTTFTLPTGPVAGDAQGEASTNTSEAKIVSVNGVPTESGGVDESFGTTASGTGTISFVVDSCSVDGTVPVVYTAPAAAGSTPPLLVTANGTPQTGYAFGIGGSTTWTASAAAPGTYNSVYVQTVSPSTDTFQACTFGLGTCYTFTFGVAGSTYYYDDQDLGYCHTSCTSGSPRPSSPPT
jgi:hypothetical protein